MIVDKLYIRYFHTKLPNLDYTGKEILDYSTELRNEIIDLVIMTGYNVMLQTVIPHEGESYMILWIDKYRFQQR